MIESCLEKALLSSLERVIVGTDDLDILADLSENQERRSSKFSLCLREPVPDTQSSEEGIQRILSGTDRILEPISLGEIEHVMMLQCTSPGLRVEDINKAISIYDGINTVISAWKFMGYTGLPFYAEDSEIPAFMPLYPITTGKNAVPHIRQMRMPLLVEAGSIYLSPRSAWFAGNRMAGTPRAVLVEQWRAVEIDDPIDLESWRRCQDLWLSV